MNEETLDLPRVSVILNCYNQGKYVSEAVESVLGQTYPAFELLAMDNGSTDETPEILKRYAGHRKVRLFLNRDNVSITRRFNQAVSQAKGEFISFLYSDDYYLPTKLERQVECFNRLGPDYGVVYSPGFGLNSLTGATWQYGSIGLSGDIFRLMMEEYHLGAIDMISPMTRKDCLERYPFHEEIFAEGEGIFFRIALRYKFHYLDEPLAVLRDTGSNLGKAPESNDRFVQSTLDRLQENADFPAWARPIVRKYRSDAYRDHAWQSVRVGGNLTWARQAFAESIRYHWANALHYRTIAGLAISYFPKSLSQRLNRVGDRLRNIRHNSVYVNDTTTH